MRGSIKDTWSTYCVKCEKRGKVRGPRLEECVPSLMMLMGLGGRLSLGSLILACLAGHILARRPGGTRCLHRPSCTCHPCATDPGATGCLLLLQTSSHPPAPPLMSVSQQGLQQSLNANACPLLQLAAVGLTIQAWIFQFIIAV